LQLLRLLLLRPQKVALLAYKQRIAAAHQLLGMRNQLLRLLVEHRADLIQLRDLDVLHERLIMIGNMSLGTVVWLAAGTVHAVDALLRHRWLLLSEPVLLSPSSLQALGLRLSVESLPALEHLRS